MGPIIGYCSLDDEDYNSSRDNRKPKKSIEEKKLEEKIADEERVNSFSSPWDDDPTKKITITNKDTIKKRLKIYSLLGLLGLGAIGVSYGLYKGVEEYPRIMNSRKYDSNKSAIEELVDQKKYGEAEAQFNEIYNTGFTFPDSEKAKEKKRIFKEEFYERIKLEKKEDLDSILASLNYDNALNFVDNQEQKKLFSQEELSELEKKVQAIHPDNLLKTGGGFTDPNEILRAYLFAEEGLEKMGNPVTEAQNQVVVAYLDTAVQDYARDDIATDRRWRRVRNLSGYLDERPGFTPSINEEKWSSFVDQSKQFMKQDLLTEWAGLETIDNYLSSMDAAFKSLKMDDHSDQMKAMVNVYLDYCVDLRKEGSHPTVSALDYAMKLDQTY